MYGGMESKDRERIKAAFQTDPKQSPVRILLATDAASEGLDLQNHCSRLIHYEIPWNPNRMEQRNGRIDRHGQRASQVNVYHFVPKGWEGGAPGRHDGQRELSKCCYLLGGYCSSRNWRVCLTNRPGYWKWAPWLASG